MHKKLTKNQREFFEENGFLLLENVISAEKLQKLKSTFEDLFSQQRDGVERNLFTLFAVNKGQDFLDLVDTSETFDLILDIMGPCIQLSSSHVLNRPKQNGFEGPMHSDGGPSMQPVVVGKESLPIQIKIQYFLTDLQSADSGNFIMVPGTHRSVFPSYTPDWNKNVQITQLKAKAGDAVIFSSSLWHGATQNLSGNERKSIIYGYSQLFVRPFDYLMAPDELLKKCSPRQERLLGNFGTRRPNIFYYPPVDQVAVMEGINEEDAVREILLRNDWMIFEEDNGEEIHPTDRYELLEFINEFEDYAPWDVLLKRSKDKNASPGQALAEFLLVNQATIPTDWQKHNLIFPGTIWKSRTGHLHCPYLKWDGGKWQLRMYWLLFDFYKEDRLLHSR